MGSSCGEGLKALSRPLDNAPMACSCVVKRRRLSPSSSSPPSFHLEYDGPRCACLDSTSYSPAATLCSNLPVITTGLGGYAYPPLWRVAAPTSADGLSLRARKRLPDSDGGCFIRAVPLIKPLDEQDLRARSEQLCRTSVGKAVGRLALRPLVCSCDGALKKRYAAAPGVAAASPPPEPGIVVLARAPQAHAGAAGNTAAGDVLCSQGHWSVYLRPIPASEQFARQAVDFWPAPAAAAAADATTTTSAVDCAGRRSHMQASSAPHSISPSTTSISTCNTHATTTTTMPSARAAVRCDRDGAATAATGAAWPLSPGRGGPHAPSAAAAATAAHSRAAAMATSGVDGVRHCGPLHGSATSATASTATSRQTAAPAPVLTVISWSASAAVSIQHFGSRPGDEHQQQPHMRPLMLRLWPLGPQPQQQSTLQPQRQPELRPQPLSSAHVSALTTATSADSQLQLQPQPPLQQQLQYPLATAAPCNLQRKVVVSGCCDLRALEQQQQHQQPQRQQPVLGGLERLLQAAEAAAAAAAAAVAACEQRSVKSGGHAPAGTEAAVKGPGAAAGEDVSGGGTALLPERLRVRPDSFFEVDGRLLHGAVLLTACHLIRLFQLGSSNMAIVPAWVQGTAGGPGSAAAVAAIGRTSSGGAGGGGMRVTVTPTGRRVVPLAVVLKALVMYAGAARAMQQTMAGKTAAAAAGTTAARVEGLGALLPLMCQAYDCAELLMAEVVRVLTEVPVLEGVA